MCSQDFFDKCQFLRELIHDDDAFEDSCVHERICLLGSVMSQLIASLDDAEREACQLHAIKNISIIGELIEQDGEE